MGGIVKGEAAPLLRQSLVAVVAGGIAEVRRGLVGGREVGGSEQRAGVTRVAANRFVYQLATWPEALPR